MSNIYKNKKGGTILMMTVIVLSGVLVVTLGASEIVKLGLRMGRTQLNSTKAFFAAETAAEQVLQEVWKLGIDLQRPGGGNCAADDWVNFDDLVCAPETVCCVDSPKIYSLMGSNYGVIYDKTGSVITFRAIGSSTDIQRIMEISYCVPDCTGKDCGDDNGCGTPCPEQCFTVPGCLLVAPLTPGSYADHGAGPCCNAGESCYECIGGTVWNGVDDCL